MNECSDNYSKIPGSLGQYCKDILAINNNATVDFINNNLTYSFSFKVKMTSQIGDNGTKNVEIMVPSKYNKVTYENIGKITTGGDAC